MHTSSPVRVRFAPSPTGHLHIGGLRTALFNWLFARHHGGVFLLRIEDTDLERSKQEYLDAIMGAFEWMNISSDEPIIIQSQQVAYHQSLVQQLVDQGKAYRCYCTPEQVAARQKHRVGSDLSYVQYDRYCLNNPPFDSLSLPQDERNKPFAIRFLLPDVAEVTFDDLIRGPITIPIDQLDDFIILRSDGRPMYNFAVVADDAQARITHIIRGDDHISNTPKQLLLYQALNFPVPYFAHLPMILGPSGERLSKRDGATSVFEYRALGFLPDALMNYLVRLGWSHGDQEIFSRAELISLFSLEHVGKKGAIFDLQKLSWVNSVYIRAASADYLVEQLAIFDPTLIPSLPWTHDTLRALIDLYKDRVATLKELADELRVLAHGPSDISPADKQQWITADTSAHLAALITFLESVSTWDANSLSSGIKELCKRLDCKLVALAQPIRLALVGKTASPGIFELLAILGARTTLVRLRALQERISN